MTLNAGAGLRWLDHAPPDLDQARAAMQRIVSDGRRAAGVIENIRGIFKREPRIGGLLDVNAVIREALSLIRDELQTHQIVVQSDCNEPLPRVEGDQVQLQQVLVNLIMNAIDSLTSADGTRVLRVTSRLHSSGGVEVSVQDFGKGVEPDAVDRIFHPLFTTKAHGMGMGLSICRSIIEAHGGQLWVTASRPHGAIFHFAVPAQPDKAPAPVKFG
jgi:signal transduction histidine kinase